VQAPLSNIAEPASFRQRVIVRRCPLHPSDINHNICDTPRTQIVLSVPVKATMKLSISILSLLFLFSAPTLSLLSKSQELTTDASLKVPGDSPLQYCEADQSTDILTLEYFNVDPNPPMPYDSASNRETQIS
jgi:hypothetical protein